MRLVALVESADHVCARYRLAAFAPHWRAAGVSLDLLPYPAGLFDRLRLPSKLAGYDGVIVQRKLMPRWLLAPVRRAARTLIFDFDDAVFLRDSFSRRGTASMGRAMRFAATVRAADVIVAGNDWLAEQTRKVPGCRSVNVVPTCVEPTLYPLAKHVDRPGLRLAWIGSRSTLRGLELARPHLEAAGRAVPGLELHIISDASLPLMGVRVLPRPWSAATEAADLASCDVGISHIPDDDWSRGKCGLKVVQCMMAGLPVVANPVGVHSTQIAADCGILATTPDDWANAVLRLAGDVALRRAMGGAGRARAEAAYAVRPGAERWLRVLQTHVAMTRAA